MPFTYIGSRNSCQKPWRGLWAPEAILGAFVSYREPLCMFAIHVVFRSQPLVEAAEACISKLVGGPLTWGATVALT